MINNNELEYIPHHPSYDTYQFEKKNTNKMICMYSWGLFYGAFFFNCGITEQYFEYFEINI